MIILKDYYSKKLSAGRLRQAYDLAPDRVRRYLESEIRFVKERIKPGELVLELGCGYGRVMDKLVICIQNGISAFNVNQEDLIKEALRVTRSGGRVLFSSYSEQFWPDRLNWFRIQAEHDLVGKIDEEATGSGVIVCKDGFRATTVGPEDFRVLTSRIGITAMITEVNGSSIFCEIEVP